MSDNFTNLMRLVSENFILRDAVNELQQALNAANNETRTALEQKAKLSAGTELLKGYVEDVADWKIAKLPNMSGANDPQDAVDDVIYAAGAEAIVSDAQTALDQFNDIQMDA